MRIIETSPAPSPRRLRTLGFVDRHLANGRFLAGDRFSNADISLLVAFDFMKPGRLACPPDLANVLRWHREVSARPSATT